MGDFSHLNETGDAAFVDVSGKAATLRLAKVQGYVRVSQTCALKLTPEVLAEIRSVARISGIYAAKETSRLIPLCHPIPLADVDLKVEFDPEKLAFTILSVTKSLAVTGVEMEAFCAATIAAATIYDMIKAIDPGAELGPFRLLEKIGGKKGMWRTDDTINAKD